ESHTEDHGGQNGNHQVEGKAAVSRLTGQADHYADDLGPVFPHDGQDGAKLDDDIESLEAITAKADQVGDDDLVAGTGDRQKFGETFDDAEDQCLDSEPEIHAFPYLSNWKGT